MTAAFPVASSAAPYAIATDAALLAAAALGDRAANDELIRRYIDFVYAAACRQTRDPHAADDITQAVFVVLSRKAGGIAAPALPAWLHRTTGYAASAHRRAARRRSFHERAAVRPEGVMPEPPTEPDPLLPLLDDAIASLNSQDRTAIIERYLRGRDVADVALALGVSPSAAQKRVERAVIRLRRWFVRAGLTTGAAAITATLTAAAPSPASAAPPALLSSLLHAAAPTKAVAATLTAKGVFAMMLWNQIKLTAGLVLTGGVVVAAGAEVIHLVRQPGDPIVMRVDQPTDKPTVVIAPTTVPAAVPTTGPTFLATLKNGVTVELIGVGECPSGGKPWWRPDGSPLAAPYAKTPGLTVPGTGKIDREFACRVTSPKSVIVGPGVESDISFTFSVKGSNGAMGGSARDANDKPVPGLTSMATSVPDAPASVYFEIAFGGWIEEATVTADGGVGTTNRRGGGDIAISPATDTSQGDQFATSVELTETGKSARGFEQRRIVFIDKNGREWPGYSGHVKGTKNQLDMTYTIAGLRLTDVASIRYETRAYDQWVRFDNVAIHAGDTAAVKISTSDDAKAKK